jgi:hypothetical protein
VTAQTPGAVCQWPRTVSVRDERYEVPCGSRYCAACGLRWQGDQRVQAVAASEHLGGTVGLLTVTGPGGEYFARYAREHGGDTRLAVATWNRRARRRWRRLHLRATRMLRDRMAVVAPGWRVLFRSWEYQKRGVLHLHLVVPYGSDGEREVTDAYVANLHAMARREGFGYVMGGDTGRRPRWDRVPRVKPADGPAAARYVCKYVAATGAGKEGMVHVAKRTATRGSVLYISPTLTQASGINMSKLRNRRRVWSRFRDSDGEVSDWPSACLADSVQRGRPPLTREGVRAIVEAARATRAGSWVDAGTGEVLDATEAPPPRQNGRTEPGGPRRTGRLVLRLAPVLLPDPDRPWLGPWRTSVEVLAG